MKHFYLATAAAAVLSLAACSQKIDINEPVENPTFEITATVGSDDATKTAVADDWSVSWTENDEISAAINDKSSIKFSYSGGNKFTTTDFTAADGTDYTWNLLYFVIGRGITGIENGYNTSTIRIPSIYGAQAVAANDKTNIGKQPLYGYATTTGKEQPTVVMKHLTSVIAVELTNTGSEDLDITSIRLENDADKTMSGNFYVNCADGSIKPAEGLAWSHAGIDINDGTLAGNTTATFYIPTCEFSLEAGNNITITVTDKNEKIATVVKPMTAATTFAAGKIKTTKFSLSSADFKEDITKIAKITEGLTCTVKGTVVAKYAKGDVISDATGSVLLYLNKETSYKIGEVLKVKGTVGTYGNGIQFTNEATITSEGNAEVTYPEPVVMDAAEAEKYINLSIGYCKYVSMIGTLNISTSNGKTYYNVVIDGTTSAQGSISYPTDEQKTALSALNGKYIALKGYSYAASSNKFVNIVMTEVSEYAGPVIKSVSGETSWDYDKTDAHTLTVEGNNLDGKTITVSGNSHFNVAVNGTTLTVTPSAALSDTDDAVSETITVAVEGGNSTTITLTHKKKVSGDVKYYTKVTSAPEDWSGTYLIVFPDNKAHSYVSGKDLVSSYNTALTIADGEIEQTENTIKDEVVIESTTGGYKIKLSDGKYLVAPSSNACNSNTTGTVYSFTVDATGIQMKSNDRYLVQNGTFYRMYTSIGSYKLPNLYKLAE